MTKQEWLDFWNNLYKQNEKQTYTLYCGKYILTGDNYGELSKEWTKLAIQLGYISKQNYGTNKL